MYAIFRAQGKQFRAVPEGVIRIPTLAAEPGEVVTFDDVLLAEREGDVHIGAPTLEGASVAAEVVAHGRGEKIVVYKMKRRKGYRRKQGHRQGYTEVRVVGIELPKGRPKRPEVTEKPKAKAAPPAEKPDKEPTTQAKAAEIDITDAARALAEEAGLDLGQIDGTGKDGRILKSDVDKAIKAKEAD